MDECELACDRIGIMVDGQFQCLGSLQRLKDRFGKGYALSIKLLEGKPFNLAVVQAAVALAFPGSVLRGHHQVCWRMTLYLVEFEEYCGKHAALRQVN